MADSDTEERPTKRLRRGVAFEDEDKDELDARRPTASTARETNRPPRIRTTGAPSPEAAPPQTPSPRTTRRRGSYLGQVLGTGDRVNRTPSPRSVRNRPPTPYARRMSLPRREREVPEDNWEPSIVIGRSLGENLSRAETARRAVMQWEAVYEHTLQVTPQAVDPILEQLENVRMDLDEMEMTKENTTP
ncbi:MAG: hypothetical protein IMZ46_13325 [Acidobacteria bacterium]|nr:hypothetical protein [Acidobacteriota bacterium]